MGILYQIARFALFRLGLRNPAVKASCN